MSSQISVFFDTNFLEARHEAGKLQLSSIRLNIEFYKTLRFIKDKSLETQVEICIPEVVWLELREHMRAQFCSDYQSLESNVQTYKKTFGDLCDLQYSFGDYTKENYQDYLSQIETTFFDSSELEIKVIRYPRETHVLEYLVGKAIRKERPFFQANGGKKQYNDAGFKDALIAITIEEYCRVKDSKGVLITEDQGFPEIVKDFSLFTIAKSADELTTLLAEIFGLTTEAIVRRIFEDNEYIKDRILKELDIINDDSVTRYQIGQITSIDESNFIVPLTVTANEVKYLVNLQYDTQANDIVDLRYEIRNE